ncbi:MAG: ABC transporter ATP-binding protein [Acholeplasmataceae bacterium]|nr:ABC transporter ATP-binding protein [Acholeplasmataceae bacterium]
MNKSDLISVENLVVEYKTDENIIHAVNGVSFSVVKGTTLGLVGETGAGKTTIAKSILRILPKNVGKVLAGKIALEGESLLDLPEEKMRRIRGNKISMIFQDPMTALNPVNTIGYQIAETIRLHNNITRKEARKSAEEMLEMVGILKERYEDYPFQFSGGMRQRVVIAMALACKPSLLICDEPTTALDVTIQAQVLDMISNLKKQLNAAVIMITHDLGIVAETCDMVAVIYAGRIVEYGTVEDIFDNPKHPYTVGLFNSLPQANKGGRLHPIEGLMPDPSNLPKGCAFSPRCPFATKECSKYLPDTRYWSERHYSTCCKAEEE